MPNSLLSAVYSDVDDGGFTRDRHRFGDRGDVERHVEGHGAIALDDDPFPVQRLETLELENVRSYVLASSCCETETSRPST